MTTHVILLLLFLVVTNLVASDSYSIIKTLPGFPGNLPFKLETGYIGVGDLDNEQLFYYFIESERSSEDDPLLLWLTGGPGCSGFSGLVYEIGPLSFDYKNSRENLPIFVLNPYSWTKVANIIFLDAPVGTGFSYAKSWQGYNMTDTLSAALTYSFLRKWLMAHPKFLKNQLYLAGDSYSGKIVPMIVQEISEGLDAGIEPILNLKGYVLGNPVTDENKDINSRIQFSYLKALITHEIYESAKMNCKGEYINVDPSNGLCKADLQNVTTCTQNLYLGNILEPDCSIDASPKPKLLNWHRSIFMEQDFSDSLLSPTRPPTPWCRVYNYYYSYEWANDKTVQRVLGVREGTIKDWARCNKSLSYIKDIPSSLNYHRNLIKRGYRVLIYSGDLDLAIPYVGTETWIKSLNLTIDSGWQPWSVEGQVAGYWMRYIESIYSLTYATVKGGGHTAPEYKPKECLAMIRRWLALYPM
ncbi:serine carboxypeptidase-like 17 [Pistacia vera]|uniref:serine carboxypeptidase-like 17 n=1 Tax=Pistacia vera TaxID=55513 RepID=UPI001263D4A1|nr:serine carboxypeptidase-like 17 [Pistacia vera]